LLAVHLVARQSKNLTVEFSLPWGREKTTLRRIAASLKIPPLEILPFQSTLTLSGLMPVRGTPVALRKSAPELLALVERALTQQEGEE
jgi:hypothetical protein